MTIQTPLPAELSSARFRLKSATAADHQAVDRGFAGLDLKDREDYRRYLTAIAAALVPMEAAAEVAGAAALVPDWQRRTRHAAILADLEVLGGSMTPIAIPPLQSAAQTLGALYVLEGSRLGGRMLARTVRESADAKVREAMQFITHGEEEKLWPTFVETLDASLHDEIAINEAISGARDAFAAFRRAQKLVLGKERANG